MKKALIVWGGWEGHTPEAGAKVIAGMLGEDGFDVEISNSTKAFANPDIHKLDLIVPIITQSRAEKDEISNLVAAVESGVGLGGYHGGMGDSFREAVDYQFMVGGQWVAHPGNIIDYRVNIIDKSDPITDGIEDFDYHSEQYYMHVDPANDVLATTTFSGEHAPWIDGVVMPVVWKRKHGKGRVFFNALGHTADEFNVREMRIMTRRGLNWAAGNSA
ncbi:MAG: ThuA domain-containing protein [Rhizobiaceae bacterium]|nr:ThuA domain-containing protein [Rhizobiaceae bacterium]